MANFMCRYRDPLLFRQFIQKIIGDMDVVARGHPGVGIVDIMHDGVVFLIREVGQRNRIHRCFP